MAQIPILNGIYSDMTADFRTSYPRNMHAVPKATGLSNGYLKTAEGVDLFCVSPGIDRGSWLWNGVLYRVSGTSLIKVNADGTYSTLGNIPGYGQCSFDNSFDRMSISNGAGLYFWNGSNLVQVTDPDLGVVIDHLWVDGYFMTTDGDALVVTELNDSTLVDPLKYGSSEIDPDPVIGLIKPTDEVYALNRYSIETFQNVGGNNFPFARVDGATIPCGLVGTHAKCKIAGTFAFLGSRKNEPCRVYLMSGADAQAISTREIDEVIQGYSEEQLSKVILESRTFEAHQFVYVHLPNETAVYDIAASQATGEPVWAWLSSSIDTYGQYNPVNFAWAYDRWICGDKNEPRLGVVNQSVSTQYGEIIGWQFDTGLIYNESRGAVVSSLELVGLPGRAPLGREPAAFHSWTQDGLSWSNERLANMGVQGATQNRLQWRRCGFMRQYRGLRFRGANDTPISFARLEANLEPMA